MPLANPDTARTPRGIPVVIAVLANDEGGSLAISGYVQPAAGMLTLNPDQTFTYTPDAAFEGVDGFSYTVRDPVGGTSQGEVRVFVARPNTAPLAGDDSAAVTTGSAAAIPVLANDNDPDGDPIEIIGVDAPAHGTITVQPDGSIRYVPQADFAGIDSFTYTIGDGQGATAEASVTVMVTLPNRPPVARPDRATTVEGSAVTIEVLANDNDPDGNPLSLGGMEMPGQGSLALTPENRFTYTPRPGFVGVDSFSYTIRDDAGAAARADVTVEVTARNAPPVAVPDSLASTGQAVAFDPLANDSDPDADALQLKSLTMPLRGRVEVASDGKVTYTPPGGFTGTDGFTYQVGDGTAVSEAEVSVVVTAPAVPTYANGYRYRRRIVVPAQAAAAEVATDFVLLVQESGAWLKPASAGGKLQHAQGFDIRLELEGGAKLDHDVELYDGVAGSLIAWVRIPSYQLASQLRLFLYYGKPGMAVTEANPSGTWRGYLAVVDGRTGADRTGNGRSLTPTGVGSGTLIGPAGAYNGMSVASRSDAAFLSGLNALTVQTLIRPDAAMVGSDHGVLAQGPMTGSDAAAGLALQYLAQSSDGTANVVHFKLNCADGAAFVLSAAQAQSSTRQLLHGVWSQGGAPRLFLNGIEDDPSAVSANRTGLTSMPAGGIYLGAGARDPVTGGWGGVIDEVRLAASAFSDARIAAEAANLGAQQALYGLGGEDGAGETDAAPTAVPMRIAAMAASSVDVDVVASAYDPDGPVPLTVASVGAAAQGVVTVVGGKVRYTPFAGFVGSDSFAYTVASGGKRSTSLVQVSVTPAPAIPKLPPAATRTLRVPEDYSTPALALAAARPGDHVSLADGTYGDDVSVSVSGSTAGYVVVKSRNHGKAVLTGHWNVSGTYVWLTGLTMRRPGSNPDLIKGGKNDNYTSNLVNGTNPNYSVRLGGSYGRVTNCRIESPNGICAPTTSHNISICWNDFCCRTKPIWSQANGIYLGAFGPTSRGSENVLIARNKWYNDLAVTNWVTADPADDNDGRYCVYTGNNEPEDNKTGNNRSVRFVENFVDVTTVPFGFYFKRGYEVARNFIRARNVAFNQRHGGYSKADGTVFADLTDDKRVLIVGNNFDRGIFRLNDTDHLVVSNRMGGTTELYYGGRRTTGSSATNYSIANTPPGYTQAASRVIFVGNTFVGDIRAGEDEGTASKPWKVWGAAEALAHPGEPAQGDRIKGVKNYGANVPNQPSDDNGRFIRLSNRYSEPTVEAGTAGYQLLTGDGGYGSLVTSYVARTELEFSTGCDPIT